MINGLENLCIFGIKTPQNILQDRRFSFENF